MGGLWQYIFVLIAVLIYQVKGQDVELDTFLKAGEAEHVELEGIHRLGRPLMCYYSPDKGECVPRYPRFYYDASIGNCRMFLWSGCGGNGNRFLSKTQCMRTCRV